MGNAVRHLATLALDASAYLLSVQGFPATCYLDFRRVTDKWRLFDGRYLEIVYPNGEVAESFDCHRVVGDDADGYVFAQPDNEGGRVRVFRVQNRLPWNA